MGLFVQWNTIYKGATDCFLNFEIRFLYSSMFAILLSFTGTKSGIKLLIFALKQKLMGALEFGLQKTFLLSYYIGKTKFSENMAK